MNHDQILMLTEGENSLVAAAIHDGHAIRTDLAPFVALSDEERRREEDPYTGPWTEIAGNRIVATHSRFQVNLKQPAEKAVFNTRLGLGSYRFGDYWRMGLPLEVLIVLVAIPMLLTGWPL